MSPTRVALLGLAPNDVAVSTLSNWGVLAHMRPLVSSPKYELVAVCNSSVESARKSIDFHKLPGTVKAYGSPEDAANDPDIDLIVVCVNVGKHFMLTKPALLAKKDVFVEWPLGATTQEAEELAQLAKEQGVRTAVGLQFRGDPHIAKVKELVEGGSLGRITSSVVWGCSSVLPTEGWIEEATYYLDWKSGGNEFTIFFGHYFDTLQATLKNHHPTLPLISIKTGQLVNPAYNKTSPDHILVQGVLENGAVASLDFRKAKGAADGLGLRWLITGTEGEMEVTIPEDHLQMGHKDRAIRLRIGKEDVQTIKFDTPEEEYIKSVPYPGTNSARVYENLAQGDKCFADFEAAVKTHQLLDRIAKDAKAIPGQPLGFWTCFVRPRHFSLHSRDISLAQQLVEHSPTCIANQQKHKVIARTTANAATAAAAAAAALVITDPDGPVAGLEAFVVPASAVPVSAQCRIRWLHDPACITAVIGRLLLAGIPLEPNGELYQDSD
ncbi:hypothetical protein G7046_g91 [Stylonectria norvegica]|nr:hypothetical protein G7046_g91 [Stylonectria norvegica]